MPECMVLGVLANGVRGLTLENLAKLEQADVVIGGTRVLQLFSEHIQKDAMVYDLTTKLTSVPVWIEEALHAQKSVVVLATGDPLCHGIGAYLKKTLGGDKLAIIPNVSALQLACARAGISWQDAYICSVHMKDAGEWSDGPGREHGLYPLFKACLQHRKIIVFTSAENSPARIARMLVAEHMSDAFAMVVAENLLQDDERIISDVAVAQLATADFSDVNMVILERKEPIKAAVLFGVEDRHFHQRTPEKGLITKCEVRAVSMAMMQLKSNSIVWDIGAGSGAVGLEAARLCPNGWVYAMEKNEADVAIAKSNQQKMDIHHYTLIHAKAPDGLDKWPSPDAVFIGGSGGELTSLIQQVVSSLNDKGRLVMNFVTIENFTAAIDVLKGMDVAWSVTQIQVSRSQPILHMHRMAAENPVWVVVVEKS